MKMIWTSLDDLKKCFIKIIGIIIKSSRCTSKFTQFNANIFTQYNIFRKYHTTIYIINTFVYHTYLFVYNILKENINYFQ